MDAVRRGPWARKLVDETRWISYGATEGWAEELEEVFSFLHEVGFLDRFSPRLGSREWFGALAEARAGYYLRRIGFSITAFEPAATGCPADWEVRLGNQLRLFVEVKGPTWQSELTPAELRGSRKFQPKYMNGEASAIDVSGPISRVVAKSLPKFDTSRGNLIIAVDDLSFPLHFVPTFRQEVTATMFPHPEISGIVWLRPDCYVGHPVEYTVDFVGNASACNPIPVEAVERFTSILVPGEAGTKPV